MHLLVLKKTPIFNAVDWITQQGREPFDFQREVWQAMSKGRSGLLHASTGAGKTWAVWLGALQHLVDASANTPKAPPLTVLWITPMRALAHDTLRALQEPLKAAAPHWTSALRSSDSTDRERAAQRQRLPSVLVTTPESLSLLLARNEAESLLSSVQLVVVDEWHELLGNKRGVQVQLALARLRRWQPALMTWALSATLGNTEHALHALLGHGSSSTKTAPAPVLIRANVHKSIVIDTLLPDRVDRFPWAGHLGLRMVPQVVEAIESSASTLVFTNTRSQSERWYQALLEARPDWAGRIALHHGSLDREVRAWVEAGLSQGSLMAVVCTSSLDLGVDFQPVDRVLQIGSAKGIARLLQRAGRSGHGPGRTSRVSLVPTHSLEIVEAAAAREAAAHQAIEAPRSPDKPLDVLVQHLVTVALGGGFVPQALLAEIRSTWAYASLSDQEWQWCLDFVSAGGQSLAAYPDYHRVRQTDDGLWRVTDARIARRHRLNIGTIVSDASISVQFVSRGGSAGARLGQVEEGFIARFSPGDVFMFAGRSLELVRVHDLVAYVKLAPAKSSATARWAGGTLALSNVLAAAMLRQFASAAQGEFNNPELQAMRPLLETQAAWSAIPTPQQLLVETMHSREGHHCFIYPFAGRRVNLGLAALLAWSVAQKQPVTFSMAVNELGFELLSATPLDWAECVSELWTLVPEPSETATDEAATTQRVSLEAELLASVNAADLGRRRFREIARVAGLIVQGGPGERRSAKQVQASASLFYDVFRKHDPHNRLLQQATHEVLSDELDLPRLELALRQMKQQTMSLQTLQRPTPMSFPLMVERLRERMSTESLADRIARMVAALESAPFTEADTATRKNRRSSSETSLIDTSSIQQSLNMDARQESPPQRRRVKAASARRQRSKRSSI